MSGSSGGYCPICGKSYGPEADRCPIHGFLFQSRDALRPGVVIDGAYEILQRLGAGGMGETYLVRHAYLGENLVLKRDRHSLKSSFQSSRRRIKRLLLRLSKSRRAILPPHVPYRLFRGRPVHSDSIFVDSPELFPQMDVWARVCVDPFDNGSKKANRGANCRTDYCASGKSSVKCGERCVFP
jgi:serine/threonine protein kinase